jgi:hypothetical protein
VLGRELGVGAAVDEQQGRAQPAHRRERRDVGDAKRGELLGARARPRSSRAT